MPRIDPLQLLTCLNVLLAKNGGVLSHAEVERLAKLMGRYSKKLVSKCIYIQILKCTKTDLLGEFMRVGGWALTHTWLTDGIRGKNWPLVQEILELLLLCPVDVQRLKSNSAPKLVKQLSKDGGNEGVRIYATRLVEQWLNVVKSETKTTTNDEPTNIISPIAAMTSPTMTTTSSNNITSGQQEEDITKTTDSESSSPSAQIVVKNLLSSPTSSSEQKPQRKSSTDSGVMYKIIVKDGKQILSKIENSSSSNNTTPTKESSTTSAETTTTSTTEKVDFIDCGVNNDINENELKSDDTVANKENDKKTVEKDNKDSKLKSKSSSSSSSSKDKHKSSSTHRSSSKSSSSKSNSSSKSKSSSVSSSTSSHHRTSTDSKSRDGGKERSDKQKSSSSSSSKYSSKDKHRSEKSTTNNIKDKDKEKADQAEKDKETLSKILPPTLDKLGKIPRKIKDETTNTATNNGGAKQTSVNQSITIPSKKASMSIEIRKDTDKTKTVKTYKSQFRSHGLTEEAPPPPSRKNLKKPSSLSLPGTTIPPSIPTTISNSLSSSLKRSSPPPQSITSTITEPLSPKDSSVFPPSDKKPKIDLTSLPVNAIEKPGAIKLIAPKPKPASLVESDMFMDALFASAVPKKDARKRKRRTSGSKEPSSPSDSPVTVKAAPLKFYQDTLEEKDDNNKSDGSGGAIDANLKDKENNKIDANMAVDDEDDDIPLKKVKEDIEEKCRQQEKDDENSQDKSQNSVDDDDDQEMIENIKKPPGPGCGPDGPPGVLMLHRRRGPKKSLKWRPQEQLEEIRFFELDETERVNVTKTFTDAKQMERCNEREQFLMHRKVGSEDLMVEQTPWVVPLILCDDVPSHPDGSQSKEKKIQCEREMTTLKALYFSRAMIPDSASEPDMEHSQITEPAVIPLDDITGNPDAVNDYMKYGWPEPKGTPPRNLIDDNSNLGGMNGVMGGRGGGVLNDNDMKFQNNNQFNPFLPFGGGGGGVNNIGQQNVPWAIGGGQPNNIQNGGPGVILPPNLMAGPMNNPFQLPGNIIPQNIMMNMNGGGPQMSPSDIQNNLMPPFGQVGPSNFGPPNSLMNGPIGPIVAPLMGNNNNFGGPPMNMNGIPNMNMNNGPMRGGMNNQMNRNNNGGGGNWRSGGPSNNSGINNNNIGNNWRGGGGGGGVNPRNWVHGSGGRGICKSFMRGFCRNGNKCNYIHPGPNNNNNRI